MLIPADLFVLAGFAPPHRIPSHKKSLIAGETFDQAIAKRSTSVRITCPSATFVAISRGCDNVIRPKRCKWTSWFRVVTGRHSRAGDFCIGSQATCAIVARHVATNLHTNRE